MPEESGAYCVPTSAWRSTCAYIIGIFDLLEDEFLGIEEAS
jgi:hypothetical protein